ncbi:MAG: cupin domain-containing protein [Gammaproteobacteria bacterium]|nr:cupin domain-containing protein [Gammaproteobacteria bacterium]
MARIIFADGRQETDMAVIEPILANIGVALKQWPTPEADDIQDLLESKALDDGQKEAVLKSVDNRFETLKQEYGYTTRDMIVLHEDIPGLGEILAKFESIHYHTDDEVRYIVGGKGYFGFVDGEGTQMLVEVVAGDYINVPANAEHWFTLGDSRRIKAVRYFIDTSGWTPVYTERPLQFDESNLPWSVTTA